MASSQNAIIWPKKYLPGTTSNWVSNERIVLNIALKQLWDLLTDITAWQSYYWNCAEITPPENSPILTQDAHFSFSTFGFPPLPCVVRECVPPSQPHAAAQPGAVAQPARLAWEAETEGEGGEMLHVYHAWLLETLEDGRVRILTQESQIGNVFKDFATRKPNPMLNGHQDWLDGLVAKAKGEEIAEPGEWSKGYRKG